MENIFLILKNWFRIITNQHKSGNDFNYNDYYFYERLNKEKLVFGYYWQSEEQPFHRDKLIEYYDQSAIEFDGGMISLKTKKDPKKFKFEGRDIVIPYKVGVLRSKSTYKYGYFEATIRLPKGNMLWPAFWLTGEFSWPPEIDVLEAYSKKDNYNNLSRLQSNIHYVDNGNKKSIKSNNHPLPPSLDNCFIKYGLLWEKDKIEFYYNGYLVRKITDKKVLNAMNEPMYVIINSAIQSEDASDSITDFVGIKVYKSKKE